MRELTIGKMTPDSGWIDFCPKRCPCCRLLWRRSISASSG